MDKLNVGNMKKLNKLKLRKLSVDTLSNGEMNNLRGGDNVCGCGCLYQDSPGGASIAANASANKSYGKFSTYNRFLYDDEKGWVDIEQYVPYGSGYDY